MANLVRELTAHVSGLSVGAVVNVGGLTDEKFLKLDDTRLPLDAPVLRGSRAAATIRRVVNGQPGARIGTLSVTYVQGRFRQHLDEDDLPFLDNLRKIDLPPPYDEQFEAALEFEFEREATAHFLYAQGSWELGKEWHRSQRWTLFSPYFSLGAGAVIIDYPDRETQNPPFATGELGVILAQLRTGQWETTLTGSYRGVAGRIFGSGGEASLTVGYNFD